MRTCFAQARLNNEKGILDMSKCDKVISPSGVLEDIPEQTSALLYSKLLQDRAQTVGFDWNYLDEIINKLQEEINEFQEAITQNNRSAMIDEFGDILFTCVNIARHANLDVEQALSHSNEKFKRRFHYLERQAKIQKQSISQMTFDQMLELWEQAKAEE